MAPAVACGVPSGGAAAFGTCRGAGAGPGGPGGVNLAEAVPPPRPEPPRPAPEFNMKANDFPSLPGVPDPAPAAEPSRFLDVVKGTSKMKLDDDQDTLPDDFIQDDCSDEVRAPGNEAAVEAASVSPKPRSKNPSVSETPVVSIERQSLSPSEDVTSPPHEGLVSPPLVNGEVKTASGKGGQAINERDSGSISPRQQSLDVSGQKLTYAQIIQKKKEKEAKEAAERAAKEAEENHSEQSGKGKTEDKSGAVSAASESDPAASAAKTETEAPEPPAAAPAAGAQPAPAPAHAPVERQDSRQGGKHGGGHARLAKTNSSGGQTGDRDRPGDNKGRAEPVRQGPGGQQRPHKRTEGPKSPVTGGK